MTIQNPCKDGKCISYPICINKTIINCDLLNGYINSWVCKEMGAIDFDTELFSLSTTQESILWKLIHTFLPNTYRIHTFLPNTYRISINCYIILSDYVGLAAKNLADTIDKDIIKSVIEKSNK